MTSPAYKRKAQAKGRAYWQRVRRKARYRTRAERIARVLDSLGRTAVGSTLLGDDNFYPTL